VLQLTTPESLISRYAADIAFVTEQEPATALYDFIDQLTLAAERLEKCGCVGAEEIGPAAYLADAQHAQPGPEQQALLKQAANRLRVVDDAVDEYRDMV
jgi:hypothetical protein